MSLRNAMRKAAGLLVELPPEDTTPPAYSSGEMEVSTPGTPRTVEEIVREANGPDLDEIAVDEAQVAAPATSLVTNGKLDFAAVYRAANLPVSNFGAEQMLEALNGLPADLPLETRRIAVKSLLGTLGKSLGATPETVVADASRKLTALGSFASYIERKTNESVSKFEAEIAELEAQIQVKRAGIQAVRDEMGVITADCEKESDKLDDVLEFFSLDVYPSKHTPHNENETE